LSATGPLVPEILSQEEGRHAAAAELALEHVFAAQPALELCLQVGHWAGERGKGWKPAPL
jgi:hypothetical protein